MKTLSDEILNRYIDGELSRDEMREVEETIKNSKEDRIELNAIQNTDRSLKNMRLIEVKSNFTSLVMNKIQRSLRSRHEQKKFIISIFSIFIIMCLVIVGIVGFEIVKNFNPETSTAIKDSIKYVTSASQLISNIFNSRNISIVGGVFSFGLIISAWFFFDYSRMLRKARK
jgi:nitrate reductase NapE component